MNVVVPCLVALGALIAVGCAGTEIAPADSAATAPEDGDPIAALYAAPADVAFITVGDIRADIVVPTDGQHAAAFLGESFFAAVTVPFVDHLDGYPLPPPSLTGPRAVAPPAHVAGPDILSLLALDASDAVAPPVDIDAFFAAALAGIADDHPPVVRERGPEMQQPQGWVAPPLDAK